MPRENPYSQSLLTFRHLGDALMYTLLAAIARILPATPLPGGVARRLMESAEARAGTNPRQAQELRCAASAYLRVVR